MKSRVLLAAVAALGLVSFGAVPSYADKSDDTLHIVWRESVPNVDPYFNQLRSGFIMAGLVMDTLIFKNPDTGEFQPLLATSWDWLDDTHLRFKLREGVSFHNGEAFDADDVVYTLNFVANPESKILIPNLGFLKGATKVDQYTVDVEHQQADAGGGALQGGGGDVATEAAAGHGVPQTTPARSRSWTFSAPTSVPAASTTGKALIHRVSMTCTASAASSRGPMVWQPRVMTSCMVAVCTSMRASSMRRRSPSVNMPSTCASSPTTTVMPRPLRDISSRP